MVFIGFAVAILSFSLGLATLLFNRKNIINQIFGVFAISSAAWIVSIFITIYISTTLFWGRFAMISADVIVAALVLFAYIFPDKEKIPKWFLFIILSPMSFFIAVTFTNLIVTSVWISNGHIEGKFGYLRSFSGFYTPIYILGAIFLLVKKYIILTGSRKAQLKYVLIGIIIAFIPAVSLNAILPILFHTYNFNVLGPLFIIFMVAFTAYAILKHQFLDIKIIIQRGVVYTILVTIILGMYIAGIFILKNFFDQTVRLSALVSGAAATIIGVLSISPMERYFRRITDKIFFKDRYIYSEAVEELSEILSRNLDLSDLKTNTSATLMKILRTGKANIILNPDYGATENESLFPIFSDNKKLGFVVLDRKKSGDPYTEEDKHLVKTFANQAAVAIKKAELYERVKAYSKELEDKVIKRTAEIKKLQEEQKQMMMDISHGLQTPLAVIKGGLSQYLHDSGILSEKSDLLTKSIDDISNFIDQLLNLASLESMPDLKKEPVNLSGLISELVEYFQVLARDKKIILYSDISPSMIVLGQKDKLSELVVNLVSNAFKYIGDRDNKRVDIILKSDGINAKLMVKDNGPGIDPEKLTHIFERFYRIKENYNIPGSGLGLAICKKIVDLHGGQITVANNPDGGTSFIVLIPLLRKHQERLS